MTDKPGEPSRRELMKPVQLLGLAFGAALFAGIVTLVSMGFFQNAAPVEPGEMTQPVRAAVVAAVVAGIAFIVVLVGIALMILAVDPAQVTKTIDRPVLYDDPGDDDGPDAAPSRPTPSH